MVRQIDTLERNYQHNKLSKGDTLHKSKREGKGYSNTDVTRSPHIKKGAHTLDTKAPKLEKSNFLDDFEEIYYNKIVPLIRNLDVDINHEGTHRFFIICRPYLEKTYAQKRNGPYSIIEILFMLFETSTLDTTHIFKINDLEDQDRQMDPDKPKQQITTICRVQYKLILFMKKYIFCSYILLGLIDINSDETLNIMFNRFLDELKTPCIYAHSFYDKTATEVNIRNDLHYIYNKISFLTKNYNSFLSACLNVLVRLCETGPGMLIINKTFKNIYSLCKDFPDKYKNKDLEYFCNFFKTYCIKGNFDEYEQFVPDQKKQLESYFVEIKLIIIITTIIASENLEIFNKLNKFDFILNTRIINKPFDTFLIEKSVTKNLFSNIIKFLTIMNIQLFSLIYVHMDNRIPIILDKFIKQSK